MRRPVRWTLTALAVPGLVLGTACGGDDDAGDVSETVSDAASDAEAEPAALPAECPTAAPFDVEVRLAGEGDRQTLTVVDAVALRRLDGRAWTVYLADFELPDDTSWSFAVPEVPPGATLVSTGLDVFNAPDAEGLPILEVGDGGPLFREAGEGATATFFSVTADDVASTSVDQTGSTELLALDGEQVCLTTEITSEQGLELVGTYTAPVVADI